MEENIITKKSPINQNQIAGAIIIAGLLIAGAILLKGNIKPTTGIADLSNIKIKQVSADEHILGNANAKVMIVEYSDTECPFSKRFHDTMAQVVKEKGSEIAIIYRHFPIAQLHPIAFHEAVATECAYEQGGNETFWKYIDEVYKRTGSNNTLDPKELSKIAKDIGLELSNFNTCLDSEKYAEKVKEQMKSGNDIGVNGTPKSFIIKKGKVVDIIEGAYPYEQVIQKINKALK